MTKRILSSLALVIVSTALAIGVAEVTLRVFAPGELPWDTEIRAGWKYQGRDCCVNDLGYRGQKIRYSDRDIVVVLLGDSQVESMACTPDQMPEQALELHLKELDPRYRVFTLGSGGYGNDQELLALEEYFRRYRADVVVLWETFANDVWNNVFPTHWPADGSIKPTYWLEEGTLRGPNYGLNEVVRKPARTKIGVLLNRWLHPQRGLDGKWERYLPKPYEPLKSYEGAASTDWDPADPANRNPFLGAENLRTEKSHFALDLYPRSDRMQYGLDLTRKLIARIEALAGQHGSSFAILDTMSPEDQRLVDSRQAGQIIVHLRDGLYYRTRLSQTLANKAYVNEGFRLFTITVRVERWKVSDTDRHLNCTAVDQVMGDLAGKIVANLPVKPSAH